MPATTPAPAVTLRPITEQNLAAVLGLSVRDSQKAFVASNDRSLAQAKLEPGAWPRAIYEGEIPAGFVMLHDEGLRSSPRELGYVYLWRMMIDQRYQGRGIGRRAMELVIAHAKSLPHVEKLHTSWRHEEGNAGAFYENLGFEATGVDDEGEVQAVLIL